MKPRRRAVSLPALHYRRARSADIPAMSRIRLSVTENTLSDPSKVTLQMYRDYLDARGRGWVCCSGRRIVGFAYASRDDASIWALFIQPGHEGRGIGRKLMGFAEAWLFGLGAPAITLDTGRGTRAERFYAASSWLREPDDGGRNVRFRKQAPLAAPAP
ncbi:GNAT family N-acetyltransferase [Massilia sp. S19_KUP03_FR1]|uniref:GNAT family N-acetyltransferase n=1 Tax=Massilia sp. S19_KUP03_FR1 TaxID=3025503 RepID=UPI002FCD944E